MTDKPKHICYLVPVEKLLTWIGSEELPNFEQYVVHATLDDATGEYVITSKTLTKEW